MGDEDTTMLCFHVLEQLVDESSDVARKLDGGGWNGQIAFKASLTLLARQVLKFVEVFTWQTGESTGV